MSAPSAKCWISFSGLFLYKSEQRTGGSGGTRAQGAVMNQRDYFHSRQRIPIQMTSKIWRFWLLNHKERSTYHILTTFSRFCLHWKIIHQMARRAVRGRDRCKGRGSICNHCKASLCGESCLPLAFTEVKYVSCPFGQREWKCRMGSNSLSRQVKFENTSHETYWKYQKVKTALSF